MRVGHNAIWACFCIASHESVGISGTQCDSGVVLRCIPRNSGMQCCDGSIPRCVPRLRSCHSVCSVIFLRNEGAQRKIISKWPFIPRITCATGVWCDSVGHGSARFGSAGHGSARFGSAGHDSVQFDSFGHGSVGRGSVGRGREQQQALTDANDRRKWSISRFEVRNGHWDRTQRPLRTPNCDFDHKEHRIINNVQQNHQCDRSQ